MLGGCSPWAPQEQKAAPQAAFEALERAYPDADLRLGRRLFLKHCSVCHQATGAGASKAIPPLRDHIPHLAAHPEGRTYLARLMLFGLNGPIAVNGQKFMNAMPALGALMNDQELAAAVNWAQVSWGNDAFTAKDQLLRPEDLARARKPYLPAKETLKLRQRLWPDGTIPRAPAQPGAATADPPAAAAEVVGPPSGATGQAPESPGRGAGP